MARRRYLITGGAGFIGSHLAEALLSGGSAVTVLDDLSTGSRENLAAAEAADGFRFVEGSVLSSHDVSEAMEECDTVFHLAAAVGVDLVVRSPVWTIETNVHGTENILDAAAQKSVRRVFLASTSEVYGRSQAERFRETDDLLIGPPTVGRWSYAASKLLDEFLALSFCRERGLGACVTRFFNTVGPRQTGRYGMVLPRFVEAALANRPLRVFGDGRQTRCFCHVADTVRALLALDALQAAAGRIFNIGTDCEISINDLAETVIRICGSSSSIVHVPYEEAYEPGFEDMRRRAPDTAALQQATGWTWNHSLETIVTELRDHVMGSAS